MTTIVTKMEFEFTRRGGEKRVDYFTVCEDVLYSKADTYIDCRFQGKWWC